MGLRMRSWIIGLCAVLTAGAAQAQDKSEHYATVGAWEVAIEPGQNLCKMYRFYGSSAGEGIEGLIVRYDAINEDLLLTWTTENLTYLPAKGDLEMHLNFVKGQNFDDAWGARDFHYEKPADTHYFTHQFAGGKESQRFLRDLGGKEILGLDLGAAMLTALFLEASEATETLRECSSKLVLQGAQGVAAK